MSDEEAGQNTSNRSAETEIVPVADKQGDLFSAASFLQIEHERIDSYNRRTEVARQAVSASNEADQRQYDFQMANLASEDSASKRKDALAEVVVKSVGSIATLVGGLFLYMTFFGNPNQQAIALSILRDLAVGGGGFGVISGLITLVRRLLRK